MSEPVELCVPFVFKVTYFKRSGKMYSADNVFVWEIEDCGSKIVDSTERPGEKMRTPPVAYMSDVTDKIRQLRDHGGPGALPGLSSEGWEGFILVESESGFPCLVLPADIDTRAFREGPPEICASMDVEDEATSAPGAHVFHDCSVQGPFQGSSCEPRCVICDGGLAFCTVCKAGENELTTECPGVPASATQRELVCGGKLDFRKGCWISPLNLGALTLKPKEVADG